MLSVCDDPQSMLRSPTHPNPSSNCRSLVSGLNSGRSISSRNAGYGGHSLSCRVLRRPLVHPDHRALPKAQHAPQPVRHQIASALPMGKRRGGKSRSSTDQLLHKAPHLAAASPPEPVVVAIDAASGTLALAHGPRLAIYSDRYPTSLGQLDRVIPIYGREQRHFCTYPYP